jgi:hypothetical protein
MSKARVWDIVDQTEPGIQITEQTKVRTRIFGSGWTSSLAKVAIIVTSIVSSTAAPMVLNVPAFAASPSATTLRVAGCKILQEMRFTPYDQGRNNATDYQVRVSKPSGLRRALCNAVIQADDDMRTLPTFAFRGERAAGPARGTSIKLRKRA